MWQQAGPGLRVRVPAQYPQHGTSRGSALRHSTDVRLVGLGVVTKSRHDDVDVVETEPAMPWFVEHMLASKVVIPAVSSWWE